MVVFLLYTHKKLPQKACYYIDTKNMNKITTHIVYNAGILLFLLLIPFVAMFFTDQVVWTLSDFIIAGILLSVTSLFLNITYRKFRSSKYRFFILLFIVIVFILVWGELAVGIFGTPWAGS